jgi:hypothetical protein
VVCSASAKFYCEVEQTPVTNLTRRSLVRGVGDVSTASTLNRSPGV